MTDGPGEILLELKFPSRSERLGLVRGVVRETASRCGCSPECAEMMVLAVNEACVNVIQHGYHRNPNGEIILEIWRNDDDLIFRLVDFAAPVDATKVRPRALDDVRPGGLGTHLIREAMDEATFLPPPDGAGNLLQMVKRIG